MAFNNRICFGASRCGRIPGQESQDTDILVDALQSGYTIFDTAESYGKSETLLGDAIKNWSGDRSNLQLVSKISKAHTSTKQDVIKYCMESLDRLQTDYLDVYLVHFFNEQLNLPVALDALLELKQSGIIKEFGVSNCSPLDLKQWKDIELANGISAKSKEGCTVLQTSYNIVNRKLDRYLLNLARSDYDMAVMSYSTLQRGEVFENEEIIKLAQAEGITVAQLCIAWVLRCDGVIPIPRSSTKEKMLENLSALTITLSQETLAQIDNLFPVPPLSKELLQDKHLVAN
jgi:diketogulonate reductase-like aldo/keto reductase